ncbi:hypothetical protein ABK040_012302 [Willaertia magna]
MAYIIKKLTKQLISNKLLLSNSNHTTQCKSASSSLLFMKSTSPNTCHSFHSLLFSKGQFKTNKSNASLLLENLKYQQQERFFITTSSNRDNINSNSNNAIKNDQASSLDNNQANDSIKSVTNNNEEVNANIITNVPPSPSDLHTEKIIVVPTPSLSNPITPTPPTETPLVVSPAINPEHHYYTQSIRNLANEVGLALKAKGYSTWRILGIAALIFGILGSIYSEEIKNFFSEHGADVASRSLSSENVQISAETLSKAVVQQVLNDPKTIEHAVNFLTELISRPETQKLLVDLLLQVLKDEGTQKYAQTFVKEVIAFYLMQDEHTLKVTTDFVVRVLAQKETKDQLVVLLNSALQEPSFRHEVAELFSSVILYDVVKKSAAELGIGSVHTIMDDEAVQKHSEEFVHSLLMNKKIQHDAGFALYEAMKVSITPGWFYYPPKKSDDQQNISNNTTNNNNTATEENKTEEVTSA